MPSGEWNGQIIFFDFFVEFDENAFDLMRSFKAVFLFDEFFMIIKHNYVKKLQLKKD